MASQLLLLPHTPRTPAAAVAVEMEWWITLFLLFGIFTSASGAESPGGWWSVWVDCGRVGDIAAAVCLACDGAAAAAEAVA